MPGRISGQKLDDAGQKHEAKHQPAEEPDQDPRSTRQEYRQESRLEQQRVPLKAHEFLSGIDIGQIEHEQSDERRPRPSIHDDQQSQHYTGDGTGDQRRVAAVHPEQRGQNPVRRVAKSAVDRFEVVARRQNSCMADQS